MSFEKFIEKARKEPEKYRDLLIKEKESFEDDVRKHMDWILALFSIEVTYSTFITTVVISYKIYHPVLGISVFTFIIPMFIMMIFGVDKEKKIREVREILYDNMNLENTSIIKILGIFGILVGIAYAIIILLAPILFP